MKLDVMVQLLSDIGGLGATGEILVGAIEGDQIRYLMPSKYSGSRTAPLAEALGIAFPEDLDGAPRRAGEGGR